MAEESLPQAEEPSSPCECCGEPSDGFSADGVPLCAGCGEALLDALLKVWRDTSPPAFTAETPNGSHAAWWFTAGGRDFGPYFTRHDAKEAATAWHHANHAASPDSAPKPASIPVLEG